MTEWPRGEDEARVARNVGTGASGCRDWAHAGTEARVLGSDVSQAKGPTRGGVQDQVLSSCN